MLQPASQDCVDERRIHLTFDAHFVESGSIIPAIRLNAFLSVF
jgi:hypothetical protein